MTAHNLRIPHCSPATQSLVYIFQVNCSFNMRGAIGLLAVPSVCGSRHHGGQSWHRVWATGGKTLPGGWRSKWVHFLFRTSHRDTNCMCGNCCEMQLLDFLFGICVFYHEGHHKAKLFRMCISNLDDSFSSFKYQLELYKQVLFLF